MDEQKPTRRRKKSADEQIEESIAALDQTIESGANAAAAALKETEATAKQAAENLADTVDSAASQATEALENAAGAVADQADDAANLIELSVEKPAASVESEDTVLPEPLFPLPHSSGEPRKGLGEMLADDTIIDPQASSDDRIMAALAYASQLVLPLGFIFPAILLAAETSKSRPFLRYHAVQSLAVGTIVWGVGMLYGMMWATVGGLLALCLCCVLPLGIALWLLPLYYAMLAYNGKRFRIRGLTQFLEDQRWL